MSIEKIMNSPARKKRSGKKFQKHYSRYAIGESPVRGSTSWCRREKKKSWKNIVGGLRRGVEALC